MQHVLPPEPAGIQHVINDRGNASMQGQGTAVSYVC